MLLTRHKALHLITGAIATFNLLALKLLIKNPARAQTYPGMVFRDYMSLVGKEQWASKDIFEILPIEPGLRITLEHLPGQGVGTPIDELAYLALITRALNPKKIFEIGTFRGRTALNFALNSPQDCRVYTLDLPPADKQAGMQDVYQTDAAIIQQAQPGEDYRHKDVAGKITQLYGDSTDFDFSPYSDQIDLVFVDGAHHFQAVRQDTLNALQMVRPGGYIVWHDFANFGDYNDVTRAILDVLPKEEVTQISNTQLAIFRKAFD
jgi:predicted O-methyltransferase YrrM